MWFAQLGINPAMNELYLGSETAVYWGNRQRWENPCEPADMQEKAPAPILVPLSTLSSPSSPNIFPLDKAQFKSCFFSEVSSNFPATPHLN